MSYSTIQMLEIQGFRSYNENSAENRLQFTVYPVNGNDIWYTDIVISELLYERSHFNHGIY